MSSTSSRPVLKIPVPASLSSTTPKLPDLTSTLLVQHLRTQTNTIPELQSLLRDNLARTGWEDRVRALALELIRSGRAESFPEVFEEVLQRCRMQSGSGPESGKRGGKTVPGHDATTNGNANSAIAVRDGWFGSDGLPDVRIPAASLETAVDFLKEKVRRCVEVVEDD